MKTFLIIIFTIIVVSIGHSQTKISDTLAGDILKALDKGTTVKALVILNDQFNADALVQQRSMKNTTAHQLNIAVVTSLMQHAEQTQSVIANLLDSRIGTDVIRYQKFWIVNAILVEAQPEFLYELSEREDVASLEINGLLHLIKPVSIQPATRMPGHAEPGLKVINAHKMWQLGFTGKGVIAGVIDTGADSLHPALRGNWHGNSVPASQAWNDPGYGTKFPTDDDGHGTHVLGIMAGLDTNTSDTVGVAFGSEWICGRMIEGTISTHLANLQWILNPDGNSSTTEDMPVVVNNSWGDFPGTCNSFALTAIRNLEAAGVAAIFAAGNIGPDAFTIASPAKSNFTGLQVFSVGAVDGNKEDLPIAPFSSRGPTICDQGGDKIKPEVTAPGASIRSSYLGGSYVKLAGTSMATPHVSGAIALLKQAFPDKTGTELKQMLYETARDLGEPGEDNTYGMGIIDVYQAYIENAVPGNPRPPNNVEAYSDYTTPSKVSITWKDPSTLVNGGPLENFGIFIIKDNVLIDSIPSGIKLFIDTAVTDGQQYEYRVKTYDLSTGNMSVERKVSIWAGGSPVPASPKNLLGTYAEPVVKLSWSDPATQSDGTPIDDLARIYIYRDNTLLDSVAPGVESYTDIKQLLNQTYSYSLVAADNEIPINYSKQSNKTDVLAGSKPDILVYYGKASGPVLDYVDSVYNALRLFGIPVYKTDNLAQFGTPLNYKAVFVVTGMDNDYSHLLNSNDGSLLTNYLNNGGSVYLEGHMCFNLAFEWGAAINTRPWLGLGKGDWTWNPVNNFSGLNELSGFYFQYPGLGQTWDILNPVTSSSILLKDPGNESIYGVFNKYNNGKIIGVVPSYGGLTDPAQPANKNFLMCRYLKMLGVDVACLTEFGENQAVNKDFSVIQITPNPFTTLTTIIYNLAKPSYVKLSIFDSFGRPVAEPVNRFQPKGQQNIECNTVNLSAGVYFLRLKTDNQVITKKIIKY